MKTMSRDARKVVEHFRKLTGREIVPSDVFVAESLVFTFFPNIINNIVKQIFKKSESKDRYHLEYYMKPIWSMARQKRSEDQWMLYFDDGHGLHCRQIYTRVSHFLLEDFNHDQLVQLRTVCGFEDADLQEAFKVSREADVYSIPFILRVLEGMRARREHTAARMDQIRETLGAKADEGPVVARGPLEMASFLHNWSQAIENAELESKLKKLHEERLE